MIIISLDRELFYPLKQACTSCEIARLAKNPQNRSRGEKSPKKLKKIKQYDVLNDPKGKLLSLLESSLAQDLTETTSKSSIRRPSEC